MSNQSTAKIDGNDKPTLLAYNETTGATEAVRVDPIFGYLEIFNGGSASGTYTAINQAKIDGNDNPTLLAYNDTTGLVEAVRCDNNGNLLVISV